MIKYRANAMEQVLDKGFVIMSDYKEAGVALWIFS
jgi:hypothetical protein